MIFLDTSGVMALVSPRDPWRARAEEHFLAARRCLIHNYVAAELVPLARARGLPVALMLDALAGLHAGKGVTWIWVEQGTHDRAVALLRSRPDKSYSLCDAVSFVLMREQGISEALTTDQHFGQEGFIRLLKP